MPAIPLQDARRMPAPQKAPNLTTARSVGPALGTEAKDILLVEEQASTPIGEV